MVTQNVNKNGTIKYEQILEIFYVKFSTKFLPKSF